MKPQLDKPVNFLAMEFKSKIDSLRFYDANYTWKTQEKTIHYPCWLSTEILYDLVFMSWNSLAPEKEKILPNIKYRYLYLYKEKYLKETLCNCLWELLYRNLRGERQAIIEKIARLITSGEVEL